MPSHPFLESFGSGAQPLFTTPSALAVDQSSGATGGDLLVVDAGRNERQRIVITEGSSGLSGSYKLSFNGQTTGWTGNGTVTCNGVSTTITSVTTSTGVVAKGELISSSPGSCIKPNTTISNCTPSNCENPTSIVLSQATESNASSGAVDLSSDLNFSSTAANVTEALVKLPGVGTGNVNVTEAGAVSPIKRLVEFRGTLGAFDHPTLTCDATGLAGGATCTVESGSATTPQGALASLQRFKPDGTPDKFSALGTNTIDGRRGPGGKTAAECESAPEPSSCDETPQNRLVFGGAGEVQVAVAPDGAVGGTAGNIYLTQSNAAGGKLINIFRPNGSYLGQLTAAGATSFSEPCGVAVDLSGNVFVGDFAGKIHKFTPSGNPPSNTDLSATFTSVAQSCSLAAGAGPSASFLFAKKFGGSELFKLDAGTGVQQCLIGTGNRILTLDPASGHLYAGKGSEVVEYDASGACVTALAPTTVVPSQVEGIAVDRTDRSGNVYVSRANSGSISVYGPLQEPPEVAVVSPATGITGAKATVHGEVNPKGSTLVGCRFEYGKTAAYGSSAPCAGSLPPSDSSFHDLAAELDGLLANGTVYHYRLVVETSADLTVQTGDSTFATANTFTTNPASEVSDVGAVLNGSVRLEGLALSDCVFEYGPSTSYGLTAPCSPSFSAIPNDSLDRPVTAALTDLEKSTTYHFRLRAENSAGTIVGQDRVFQTLGPPQVGDVAAGEVGDSTAKLYATVNPNGFNTNYYFEYGLTAAYGSRAPLDFDLFAGDGVSPVKASVTLSGLEEGMTYHFRLLASNDSGDTLSPDYSFRTLGGTCANDAARSQQGPAVAALPDCFALEMVTPTRKYSQQASYPTVSADGSRVSFRSIAALGNTPNLPALGLLGGAGEGYVATRDVSGWETQPTSPPPAIANSGWGNAEWLSRSFTPDFSSWFVLGSSIENGDYGQGISQLFRGDLSGAFQPFTSRLIPIDESPHGKANIDLARLQAVSADSSHVYFNTGEASATYLAGDPSPGGAGADPNAYVAQLTSEGQPKGLELLARDRDGKVWGGNCGARVGGVEGNDNVANTRDQGAVSADGSRVYFSTRPGQPTNSTPGGPIFSACNAANKMRIMLRVDSVDGPEIGETIPNECDRVAPACKGDDQANGDDVYEGASVGGTRLYLTTNRQLADSDLDGSNTGCSKTVAVAGCDLYLYDSSKPAGSRLTQVSAGEDVLGQHLTGEGASVYSGTVGISGDGSHVYFAAAGILTESPNPVGDRPVAGQPNLYVYEAGSSALRFIGTLDANDAGFLWGGVSTWRNRAYPVPATGLEDGREVGGDGHTLVFQTSASLTAGDADGSRLDVYRYDSSATPPPLECVSCRPGVPDAAAFDVSSSQLAFQSRKVGTDFAEVGRWVSEDGETIGFRSPQSLLPGASAGTSQVYLWRSGTLFLVPGSGVENEPVARERSGPMLSHDGSTVAFRSTAKLLPGDGDSAGDIYILRAGGGFLEEAEQDPCLEEACQPPPTPAPPAQTPGSSTAVSSGNVTEQPPAQKKKKVKRHKKRKGKDRGKGKGSKQAGRSGSLRTTNNQGGRK